MKLNTKGLAAITGTSKQQVSRWKKQGMPTWTELGLYYDLADVLEWLHFRDRRGRVTEFEKWMQAEVDDIAGKSPGVCFFAGVNFAMWLAERIIHRRLYPQELIPFSKDELAMLKMDVEPLEDIPLESFSDEPPLLP